MKRFWVVLLSLGLIVSFETTVFATDVKFNGEFYLQGWYNKNASLIDKDDSASSVTNRGSSAFYTQRLRMGLDFEVAKGLKFTTRFDALERKWMAARRTVTTGSPGYAATDSEAENIAFDVAYVTFMTPIGMFQAGNVGPTQPFGTMYGDNVGGQAAMIAWAYFKGPYMISLAWKKSTEGYYNTAMVGGTPIGAGTDNDCDTYTLTLVKRWSTGAFGAAIGDVRGMSSNIPHPAGTTNYVSLKQEVPYINFWIKQNLGKIFVEDEFSCVNFGRFVQFNTPYTAYYPSYAVRDIDASWAVSNYFNINFDLSPAKIGFQFVYSRGDDPETIDKKEGGFRSALDVDRSFNPCLILFNDDYMHWMSSKGTRGPGQVAALVGNTGSKGINTYAENVWLYQVYGDYKISPKLNLNASITYAHVDKKPTDTGLPKAYGGVEFLSDKLGYEADITMKYKIYDNLEYMIGAAYLWTGDYFKGTNANVKLSDTYLLTHKLTLTF